MKFYNANAGNPKRVRIFMVEKGIDVPRVDLELGKDTRTPAFRELNSLCELPVLELNDGEIITESVAICRYLEAVFPDTPLMGRSAVQQARIEMWSQRMHDQIFMPHGLLVRHTLPLFADVVDQVAEFAETQRKAIPDRWKWLNEEMSDGRPFIAGDAFSFADIEGMVALMIAGAFELPIPHCCENVNKWADAVRKRPSWDA